MNAAIPLAPLAVAGDVIAEAFSCAPAGDGPTGADDVIRLRSRRGVRTVGAPAERHFVAAAGARGMLALASQGALPGPARIDLLNPRTGASPSTFAAPRAPGVGELAVESGGVTVFCGTDRKLAWASPKAPAAHPIPGARCPTATALAGRRVAYRSRFGWVWIARLDGRRLTAVAPSSPFLFAWNGRRTLDQADGCAARFLAEGTHTAGPSRVPFCDVRVLSVTRGPTRQTLRVVVSCDPGCRDAAVSVGLGRECSVGNGSLDLHRPGVRVVNVRLRAPGRRLLRRYRSVPFRVDTEYIDPLVGATYFREGTEIAGTLPGDGSRRFKPFKGPCRPSYDPTV